MEDNNIWREEEQEEQVGRKVKDGVVTEQVGNKSMHNSIYSSEVPEARAIVD